MTLELHYLRLGLRNISRQRARSLATLASIAIGTAALILAGGFIQDIFTQLGEAIIHSQTGHIQITHQGYNEGKTQAPEKYFIEKADVLKSDLLKSSSAIQTVASRLTFRKKR